METNTGLKEEEIELELGLSLGGSYKRQNGSESRSDTTADMGSREKQSTCIRSNVSPCFIGDSGHLVMDPKKKREIHALRRQEAKKKREEKQLKKGGVCRAYFNGIQVINGDNVSNNNEMFLKVKASQSQVDRDGEMEERECKKSKTENIGSERIDGKKVNLNLNVDQYNGTPYPMACTSSPVHPTVLPVQYAHPPLQYGPPTNGFVYPCANVNVMPCWFTAGEERNVVQVQSVVSYGFVPFQAASDPGHNLGSGYDSEQNGSRDNGNKKDGSNGSPMCASSTSSDHRSFSNEGGGSSDTRSRSSPSVPEQPQLNDSKAKEAKGQSEHSATSELIEAAQVENKMIQSSSTEPKGEAKIEKETSPTNQRFATPLMKSKSTDLGKPPKPQKLNHSNSSLPSMPCVSTTGNGPNGRTINGFLYRYTKTEVSIICVCHGSSFSPAEFVQHAGGTDVSHPLKHITVIPSAF
ncbi:hypothetical protein JCGZ_17508 [Jatropha curcas]|uniref:Ninja-family protein n=2 Tax=Jatropha curcas TaxID=180498 RepID=A0A067K266_JATCU|nr:hypothetical protein JCGZ_17508 [Jatropha curcas]